MATKKQEQEIRLFDPAKDLKRMKITILGDSPIILSKMTATAEENLTGIQSGEARKGKNPVELYRDIIQKIHWYEPLSNYEDLEYTEEFLCRLLKENSPCVLGEAIWKAVLSTIVRCGFDTYSTKAKATFRVIEEKVPIQYEEFQIDQRLIPAKKSKAPILTYRPILYGWKATFNIMFTTDIYSEEQIVAFINQAGFSNGLGSHRPGTSGSNGMFHIIPNEG